MSKSEENSLGSTVAHNKWEDIAGAFRRVNIPSSLVNFLYRCNFNPMTKPCFPSFIDTKPILRYAWTEMPVDSHSRKRELELRRSHSSPICWNEISH